MTLKYTFLKGGLNEILINYIFKTILYAMQYIYLRIFLLISKVLLNISTVP